MDNETYFLDCFSKSYENWGEGTDREVYMRAFLDGYKTAMAVAFTIADTIIDERKNLKTNIRYDTEQEHKLKST